MARHFPSWLPAPLLLLLHLRHACAQCTLPDAALSSGIVGDAAGANENSCTSSMGLNAGESCDVKAAPGYAVDDGSKSYSCVGTNLTKATIQPTGCLENFFETVANTTCSPCGNNSNLAAASWTGNTTRCTGLGCTTPATLPNGFKGASTNGCLVNTPIAPGSDCAIVPKDGYESDKGTLTYTCSEKGDLIEPTASATGCRKNFFVVNSGGNASTGQCEPCPSGTEIKAHNWTSKTVCVPKLTCDLPDSLPNGFTGENDTDSGIACVPGMVLDNKKSCKITPIDGYATDVTVDIYECIRESLFEPRVEATGCEENYFESTGGNSSTGKCTKCVGATTLAAANWTGGITKCTGCTTPKNFPNGFEGAKKRGCKLGERIAPGENCTIVAKKGYDQDRGSMIYKCSAIDNSLTPATVTATGCLENFFEAVASRSCSACLGSSTINAKPWTGKPTKCNCNLPQTLPKGFKGGGDNGTCIPGGTLDLGANCIIELKSGYSKSDSGTTVFSCSKKGVLTNPTATATKHCDISWSPNLDFYTPRCDIHPVWKSCSIPACERGKSMPPGTKCSMWPKQGYMFNTFVRNESAHVICSKDGNITYPADLRPTGCLLNYFETAGGEKTCQECAGRTTIKAAYFKGERSDCTECEPDKNTICVHTYDDREDVNGTLTCKDEKEERHTLKIEAGKCEEKKIVSCENAWVKVEVYDDVECKGEVVLKHTLDAKECHPAHIGTLGTSPFIKYKCKDMERDPSEPENTLNGAWNPQASEVGFIFATMAFVLLL